MCIKYIHMNQLSCVLLQASITNQIPNFLCVPLCSRNKLVIVFNVFVMHSGPCSIHKQLQLHDAVIMLLFILFLLDQTAFILIADCLPSGYGVV